MGNENTLTYREVSTKEIFDAPNEFLNDILSALLLESEKDPQPIPREVIIAQKGIQLSNRDTHIVIRKLTKDSYADIIKDKDGFERYYITFEGAKFLNDGGYVTAYQNDQKQNRITKRNERLLIVGSWMAGIGTILLFLVEIVKGYHTLLKIGFGWILSIQLMTFLFVAFLALIAGIALGATITVSIWQAKERSRQSKKEQPKRDETP